MPGMESTVSTQGTQPEAEEENWWDLLAASESDDGMMDVEPVPAPTPLPSAKKKKSGASDPVRVPLYRTMVNHEYEQGAQQLPLAARQQAVAARAHTKTLVVPPPREQSMRALLPPSAKPMMDLVREQSFFNSPDLEAIQVCPSPFFFHHGRRHGRLTAVTKNFSCLRGSRIFEIPSTCNFLRDGRRAGVKHGGRHTEKIGTKESQNF